MSRLCGPWVWAPAVLKIPGLIQALDVAVNKPFKGILRDALDGIMEAMSQVELDALDKATDSAVGKRRVLMTRAVGEAWEQVSPG